MELNAGNGSVDGPWNEANLIILLSTLNSLSTKLKLVYVLGLDILFITYITFKTHWSVLRL